MKNLVGWLLFFGLVLLWVAALIDVATQGRHMGWHEGGDDGRAEFDEAQLRAMDDEARAAESAAAEAEARAREEAPEPSRCLIPGDRVQFIESRGSHAGRCDLGTLRAISPAGFFHVEWDDKTSGWFSPAKAASTLRLAKGDDALPRHVWIFDVPERIADGWTGPLPTLEDPVCANCRAAQTDENEFGPCKEKP